MHASSDFAADALPPGLTLEQCRQQLQAADLSPGERVQWLYRQGLLLVRAGQFEDAIATSDQALALQSDSALAHYLRGLALDGAGRGWEAIASFDRALQQQPFRVEAWKASAWTHRAYGLVKLGQFADAIASCDRALEMQPQSYHAALYKVISLVMTGQWVRYLSRRDTRPQMLRLLGTIGQTLKYRLLLLVSVLLLLGWGQGMLPAAVRHGLSMLFSAGMIGLIVADLWKQRSRVGFVWQTYCHHHWLTYGRAFATVVATLFTYTVADQIAPSYLKWGWANLVFGQPGNIIFQPFYLFDQSSSSSANATVATANIADAASNAFGTPLETVMGAIASIDYEAIFILSFWLLLLFGIPFWARLEERIFRRGAHTWRQIAVRSTQFGLVHLLAGIPILGGLVLILPGFLFACRYKYIHDRHLRQGHSPLQAQDAGVAASTADHAVYNAILISLAVGTILLV